MIEHLIENASYPISSLSTYTNFNASSSTQTPCPLGDLSDQSVRKLLVWQRHDRIQITYSVHPSPCVSKSQARLIGTLNLSYPDYDFRFDILNI